MSKKSKPIDGIIPRGENKALDDFSQPKTFSADQPKLDGTRNSRPELDEPLRESEADFEISFDELDSSEKQEITENKKWWHRKKKEKSSKSRIGRFVKRTLLFSGSAILIVGGFISIKTFLAARNVIDRSGNCPVALCTDGAALNGEGDGRVNILLVGIGGEQHDGGDLADTIIVASIDPLQKEAAMLSVPRDLYVDIPEYGSSRVNAAHAYGEQYGYKNQSYPDGGVGLLQQTIEETLDIPIHYYLRVDFEAFRQAIDSVDGVDVDLEEALYDPTFWWQFGVLDLSAGQHTLDGTTALMYVRSRKTSARGDFDRNERQQEVLLSLKEKVLSLNTFSDPRKIVSLIDSVGSHVRTNIQLSEMVRLYELSEEISPDKIVTTGLSDDLGNYLTNANIGGAAVLVPVGGDFSEVQSYVRSIFVDGFIRSENAKISVLNGSGVWGVATQKTEELESYSYNVTATGDAPTADYKKTFLYDVSSGDKSFTRQLLENRLGVEATSSSFVPEGVETEGLDFVIIVGPDSEEANIPL